VPSKSRSTSATELLARLRHHVVVGPGKLNQRVRHAAFAGDDVPDEAATYVDKVRRHAYKVSDADIAQLRSAGWTEDAIFELTVSTALGAALSRRDAARKAMDA